MSEKIDRFFMDLEAQDNGHYEIVMKMRELVTTKYPDLEETFKYGGLVYQDGSFLFAGLFARRDFVTVELGGGAYIEDRHGFLEGRGGQEGRKHVHIFGLSEIEEKHVEEYLALAREANLSP